MAYTTPRSHCCEALYARERSLPVSWALWACGKHRADWDRVSIRLSRSHGVDTMDRGKVISKTVRMETSKANRADSTSLETARELALIALPCGVTTSAMMVAVFGQANRRGRGAR